MDTVDITQLRSWIGRYQEEAEVIGPKPTAALSAVLDREDPMPLKGDPLPPAYHWLYFLPVYRHSELGQDGHARRGGFLPPVTLPRRMWAGGRFQFHHKLRIGDVVRRRSTIKDVTRKSGPSGPLILVVVRHDFLVGAKLALTEEHDIVYRDSPGHATKSQAIQSSLGEPMWSRELRPDEVLLFRYSALTFNGHRIHYDRRYSTEAEGYPGLVVHEPLIATLLLDLYRRSPSAGQIDSFSYRAVSPLFDSDPFRVCGKKEPQSRQVMLWAENTRGELAMEANLLVKEDSMLLAADVLPPFI